MFDFCQWAIRPCGCKPRWITLCSQPSDPPKYTVQPSFNTTRWYFTAGSDQTQTRKTQQKNCSNKMISRENNAVLCHVTYIQITYSCSLSVSASRLTSGVGGFVWSANSLNELDLINSLSTETRDNEPLAWIVQKRMSLLKIKGGRVGCTQENKTIFWIYKEI